MKPKIAIVLFCGSIILILAIGIYPNIDVKEQFFLLGEELDVEQTTIIGGHDPFYRTLDYNLTVYILNNGTSDYLTIVVTIMQGPNSPFGIDQTKRILIESGEIGVCSFQFHDTTGSAGIQTAYIHDDYGAYASKFKILLKQMHGIFESKPIVKEYLWGLSRE